MVIIQIILLNDLRKWCFHIHTPDSSSGVKCDLGVDSCAESLWGVRARFRRLKSDESDGESSIGSEPSVKTRVKSRVEL